MLMHEKRKWCRRRKGVSCPICGQDSWCTISEDGLAVRCTRAPSEYPSPAKNGDQAWVHILGESAGAIVQREKTAKPKPYKSIAQVSRLVATAFSHPMAAFTRQRLAESLDVSIQSLEALSVGYGKDSDGRGYSSWPSKDEHGQFIGISRRYDDGEKKTVFGTRPGIYIPDRSRKLACNPVLIVEGGSDVAAAYSIGILAIGRPSNTGGAEFIKALRLTLPLLVVGEDDEHPEKRGKYTWCPSHCKGCSHCFPGLFGAKAVASELGCKYILPPKGCKDLRNVLSQGRVREFMAIVQAAQRTLRQG